MVKKIAAMFFMAVILITFAVPIKAKAPEPTKRKPSNGTLSTDTANEKSFYLSIFDEPNDTYIVENTKITINSRMTIIDSLEYLKQNEIIEQYTARDNHITSIHTAQKVLEASTSALSFSFYMKRNGKKQPPEAINQLIEAGDIIEFIYGKAASAAAVNDDKNDNSSGSLNKRPALLWTEDVQNALTNGCEFLTLNQEKSSFYIVAQGCAGKTADVKMVNELLSSIRKTVEYDSPNDISRNILSLTFCGYDAAELVSKLSMYKGANAMGITEASNALIAYDSKQYAVPIDQINSRDNLINILLSAQGTEGGFKANNGVESPLTTALAVTALSPYIKRDEVRFAIDSAVSYLADKQCESGGYTVSSVPSSECVARTIIALASVGIEIDDKRFVKNDKNLMDILLEYKNNDGGFSKLADTASSTSATEHAIIALCAIKQGDNPYKMKRALSPPPQTKKETPTLVVKINKPPRRITIILVSLTLLTVTLVIWWSFRKKGRQS